MGHSRAQKADTHRRIVEVAARRFRERGLEGIGVAEVMKEAGVTVGGFYKHFESREALVVEAIESTVQARESLAYDAATIVEFVRIYLSEPHRDEASEGCALAAFVGDVTRADAPVRAAYTARVERTLALIASLLDGDDPDERRDRATVVLGACLGALDLARAVSDPALSDRILRSMTAHLLVGPGVGSTPVTSR